MVNSDLILRKCSLKKADAVHILQISSIHDHCPSGSRNLICRPVHKLSHVHKSGKIKVRARQPIASTLSSTPELPRAIRTIHSNHRRV